jgi:hypothetical protein
MDKPGSRAKPRTETELAKVTKSRTESIEEPVNPLHEKHDPTLDIFLSDKLDPKAANKRTEHVSPNFTKLRIEALLPNVCFKLCVTASPT